MKDCPPGLKRMKRQIIVNAPVEACYRTWVDSLKMPEFMSRVIEVKAGAIPQKAGAGTSITDPRELQDKIPLLEQGNISYSTIKHWLIAGPGGRLYEFDNAIILEIPNHFYCTTSADPRDISVQSSVFFCPDGKNQHTLIEWEVSFWPNLELGSMTQLACDILNTGDNFLEETLQDYKKYVESGIPRVRK